MQFANYFIDLSVPRIMGIVNVTPDSFSDGGQFNQLDAALFQVERMLADGATFIDVGGESTRPGAAEVAEQQEIERVIPVIDAIVQRFDCVVSVDTSKARVMHEAVAHGAGLINDVRALQEPGALTTAAQSGVPVCLMHMQGQPRTMQDAPDYVDVVADVAAFLTARAAECVAAGISKNHILLDPGFGFGKNLQHNYRLLAHLDKLACLDFPLLIGLSRKSMIGNVLEKPVEQRLIGSVTGALLAAQRGAKILRVHDVGPTMDALKIMQAMSEQE
ncbi:dihydropteroate synthase [Bowmanella sp. JS7-9]|uniref:Dihydropteroate synthase n=1 Tax=Pseudobowmanella zhangzhouensis TaxID=1537679 RepID=A0ABW1XKI3_9ALTE|nr:dihydropteroate synthase [Bowmanella sp. JS7-9]TBX27361.1 dihydropteroate synthase [Bowmanella sp. JS7-9]